MSESTNERVRSSQWKVPIQKEQPFEWKGEHSSDYLWNEDLSKAHTSGTPSDEQVGISGKDGAGEVDREPKQLDLEIGFNSAREMGSVNETPTLKTKMLGEKKKRGKGSKKIKDFSIKQEKKTPHPRPINTSKGIPVDLLSKAIDILSAPVDEVDVADDIGTFLKNWQGSGYDSDDDIENTNWDPKEVEDNESIATIDPNNRELEEGEAEDVDQNLADVTNDAKKEVVNEAKKILNAAKKVSKNAIEEGTDEVTPDDNVESNDDNVESQEQLAHPEFDDIEFQKQLAMGHGRCPHSNQIDLCEKCGDMELKAHEGISPNENEDGDGERTGPAAHTSNGHIPKKGAVKLRGTSAHSPIVVQAGAHNGKAKKGDHMDEEGGHLNPFYSKGTRDVTRKVKETLKEAAERELDENLEQSSYDTKMGGLLKALQDVEIQLGADTMDYNTLMKALGSQINLMEKQESEPHGPGDMRDPTTPSMGAQISRHLAHEKTDPPPFSRAAPVEGAGSCPECMHEYDIGPSEAAKRYKYTRQTDTYENPRGGDPVSHERTVPEFIGDPNG